MAKGVQPGEIREQIGTMADEHADAVAALHGKLKPKPEGPAPDVRGYARVIDGADIRHAMRGHSNPAVEAARKPPGVALTARDFQRIPQIVKTGTIGNLHLNAKKGAPTYEYTAEIGRHRYTYVEQVSRRQRTVGLKTFFKQPI